MRSLDARPSIPNPKARRNSGPRLYLRAKQIIPGGTQLLSKRPEMFLPDLWPAYYSRCKGAYVWDLDGRRYTDMSVHGIGACILGYADPDVDRAASQAIRRGTMCTLNCPEEVELAELLCELHPWATKVRFARGGGEAMAVAARIARAATGRDAIAFCGYHGWHDWYLAANLDNNRNLDGRLLPGLEPKGVPRALIGSVIPFHYKKREELDQILKMQGSKLAAIVMEPARSAEVDHDFLRYVRAAADRIGAVLIFDEVTSGWRQTFGGIHLKTDTRPDLAVFAKGMSNGYPMAAVVGRSSVMDAAQTTFISSTYWTERIGPSTALATIRKLKARQAPKYLNFIGEKVQTGWKKAAEENHLRIHVSGIPPLSHFTFDADNDQTMKTLFTQLMLEHGFLASLAFYATLAHTERIVSQYFVAVNEVFGRLQVAHSKGQVRSLLKGPVAHTGFARLV